MSVALGDVLKFGSDQAVGHKNRDKYHVYLGNTDHFRAPNEFVFLFISSSDHCNCFPIYKKEYNFLSYDSYISCGNLVYYSIEYLKHIKPRKVGRISNSVLLKLRSHLFDHKIMVRWEISLACGLLPAT